MLQKYLTLTGLVLFPSIALSTPLFDTFGPLPEATFGGTGIPNQEVAISSQFSNGSSIITVAMSATQRYGNPALTNDGAGTYFAGVGSNTGPGSPAGTPEGALWNFNYYIDIDSSTEALADYQITLFYDFAPALDNGPTTLGTINITNSIIANGDLSVSKIEGSQNLMFAFLASDNPGFIDAPGELLIPMLSVNIILGFRYRRTVGGWRMFEWMFKPFRFLRRHGCLDLRY
ncbi:hypothetical protein [Oceanicoccus sp. KOV_DT_Chl]|uniref:hypothetical protein n=1 Tax=Oceanicoccus sp. KOV_DT_Chl TaxID=1904639 RepID=UPI000C7CCDBC|nr:hypothetical protein [Oceanicoccus sp. KOV_DT_Chl]